MGHSRKQLHLDASYRSCESGVLLSFTFTVDTLSGSVELVLFAGSLRVKLNSGEVFAKLLHNNHV